MIIKNETISRWEYKYLFQTKLLQKIRQLDWTTKRLRNFCREFHFLIKVSIFLYGSPGFRNVPSHVGTFPDPSRPKTTSTKNLRKNKGKLGLFMDLLVLFCRFCLDNTQVFIFIDITDLFIDIAWFSNWGTSFFIVLLICSLK